MTQQHVLRCVAQGAEASQKVSLGDFCTSSELACEAEDFASSAVDNGNVLFKTQTAPCATEHLPEQ